MSTHGNLVGYCFMSGHLRSLGLRVQRYRIRGSIARVDPENSRIRWAVVVSRCAYSVPGPNSLWHIDGHYSLVSWRFVIHGGIDGFSHLIVFLKCSTNNRSEMVRDEFLTVTQNYEWPSQVCTDHGGENVLVWALMEEVRGPSRGSYIAGSSTQNQRIKCLWRDVFRAVTQMFYYTFQSMEEAGILDRNNDLHMSVLHLIFLPRINRAIKSFTAAWNQQSRRGIGQPVFSPSKGQGGSCHFEPKAGGGLSYFKPWTLSLIVKSPEYTRLHLKMCKLSKLSGFRVMPFTLGQEEGLQGNTVNWVHVLGITILKLAHVK